MDNATRYNQSLSAHRVLNKNAYRTGGLLLAPPALLTAEEAALARDERPTMVLEIGLWARDYVPVDIFNWQQELAAMITLTDLERELGVGNGRMRNAVERGEIKPDHVVELGERTYTYFHQERVEEVRIAIGAPKMEEYTIRDRFLEFIERMDMAHSYKPVMLLALLDTVDTHGRAQVVEVARRFQTFYKDRQAAGQVGERPGSRKVPVNEMDEAGVRRLMLEMPYEKFERRRFLKYDSDLAYIRFEPRLWRQFAAADLQQIGDLCARSIHAYYQRLQATDEEKPTDDQTPHRNG